jgi:hypothetical protein
MTVASIGSQPFTLTLSEDERTQLLTFLEHALRDKLVEEHRTESFQYREHVQKQEALMQGLIEKLRRT